jgi:lipopolysaccharide/colanic/teichoic acid biosynthesis glycosyltransferase
MARRFVDRALAALAVVALSPLFAVAAIGIRLTSRGPILYRARRAGLLGAPFTMFKFRTMHVATGGPANAITSRDDVRVFGFGAWLRRWKVDELPQLVNVLRGEMAIVGPRPEDPRIVDAYYTPGDYETLERLPGLASPGSIFNYTHGESLLDGKDTEREYADRLLPVKLALDRVYVRRASPSYDIRVVARTLWTIASLAAGRREFPAPPEMAEALSILESEGGRALKGRSAKRRQARAV